MQTLILSRIYKTGTSNGIVLPVEILRGLKWERGDHVVFAFGENDTLIVKKISEDDKRRIKPQPDIPF